jgi:hypothetical protein
MFLCLAYDAMALPALPSFSVIAGLGPAIHDGSPSAKTVRFLFADVQHGYHPNSGLPEFGKSGCCKSGKPDLQYQVRA